MPPLPLLVIVGPTGSGKTALAVELGEALSAEIVSADSRQIYQRLDLGTGKPSAVLRERVPHHLVSLLPPQETMTADRFADLARAAIADIRSRGKTGLLVGGTGLWIKACIDGLAPTPAPDPDLRLELQSRARREGPESLYQELKRIDPESARGLAPRDQVRTIRALEIYRLTGLKPSQVRSRPATRPALEARWFGIDLPRPQLYAQAEARIEEWLQAGWLEEVRGLLAAGVPPNAPALQAIGYGALVRHLAGEWSYASGVERIKRDTRRYIKRQLTWFKAEARIEWLDGRSGPKVLAERVQALIRRGGQASSPAFILP